MGLVGLYLGGLGLCLDLGFDMGVLFGAVEVVPWMEKVEEGGFGVCLDLGFGLVVV